MQVRVKLPPAFREDRFGRDLPIGEDLGAGWVALSIDDAREYLNDAEYYSDPYGPVTGEPGYIGLVRSAKASVKHLREALADVA